MSKKERTPLVMKLSAAAKLAVLAVSIDEHTTQAEMSAAITEAVETILGDDSIARSDALFALLKFLHDCEDDERRLIARAMAIAYSSPV